MKHLDNANIIISKDEFRDNKEVESISVADAYLVQSGGAFQNCSNLKDVYFGMDITRIGHGSFRNCKKLTDVWFAIIDKNKFIEIAEDAFWDCKNEITFHIFASAIDNFYLNDYARRHHFKVETMI